MLLTDPCVVNDHNSLCRYCERQLRAQEANTLYKGLNQPRIDVCREARRRLAETGPESEDRTAHRIATVHKTAFILPF